MKIISLQAENIKKLKAERVDSSGKVGIVIDDGAVVAVNEETP